MVNKLIELVTKYRVESERGWHPEHGFHNTYARIRANVYDMVANDLEEVIQHHKPVAVCDSCGLKHYSHMSAAKCCVGFNGANKK